jgi:hypothetical protein
MSAPTVDEVLDDLLNNADFEEQSSVTKARSFITAAKRYLILSPQSQADQSSSMTISTAEIRSMIQRAQQYVSRYDRINNGGGVRFLSASEGFRR